MDRIESTWFRLVGHHSTALVSGPIITEEGEPVGTSYVRWGLKDKDSWRMGFEMAPQEILDIVKEQGL